MTEMVSFTQAWAWHAGNVPGGQEDCHYGRHSMKSLHMHQMPMVVRSWTMGPMQDSLIHSWLIIHS